MAITNPPSALNPMADFDPAEPAILHDRRTDSIITWTGDEAANYRMSAVVKRDGAVEWNGYVFDGWGGVLGG